MRAIEKSMILGLLSLTVILSVNTYTTAFETEDSSTGESGSVMGHMTLTVLDENGNIKAYRQSDNRIVQNGTTIMAQETFGTVAGGIGASSGPVTHIGIGTGGTFTTSTDTFITSITGCARLPATFTSAGATTNGGGFATINVKATATFQGGTAGASCTSNLFIQEAGTFNSGTANAGEMFARNTFGTVTTLGSADTLTIDWTFTFSDQEQGGGLGGP